MTFQLSYTPRGSRHHPEPPRYRHTDKREEEREGRREREGENLKSKRKDTARKGSDLFSNSLSSRAVIVINVLLPGRPLELQ